MSYRITIEDLRKFVGDDPAANKKVYEQTVDEIDLGAVMAAVNRKPRKSRSKSEKKDDK